MRGRLIVGNWKSNGNLVANRALLEQVKHAATQWSEITSCGVCVPYPYLAQTQHILSGSKVLWGAQDISQYGAGAYTGAIAAPMLLDFGCHYAIVGHSERRTLFGEDDVVVAIKFEAALKAKLTPILCVGESLQEREAEATESVVARQLGTVLKRVGADALASAVIAYEPVWAIGTGKNATPDQAQSVHAFIRGTIAARTGQASSMAILYGGSVKAANAASLFAMPDIDGGLIGGASLVADDFLAICRAAARQ